MLNCKEIARLVASDELDAAAWSDRALAQLHLLMCRRCRSYVAQLRGIGDAARDRWDLGVADRANFERLQSSILEHCREASDEDLEVSDEEIEAERERDPEPPASQTDPH